MKEKNQDKLAIVRLLVQSTLMAFGGMFFPLLYLFFPALFLKESSKQGILRVMFIFFSVICLVGAVFGSSMAFILLTLFGPLILILDYCIRTQKDVGLTIIASTLIFLFSIGFNFYMYDVVAQLESGALIQEILVVQKNLLSKSQLSRVEVDTFITQMRQSFELLQSLLPAILLLVSLAVVYVSYAITGKARMLRGEKILAPPPFLFVRLPQNLVKTVIVASIVLFSLSRFMQIEGEALVYNIAFIVSGLLLFQGLAVVNFFCYRLVPIGFFRALFIGILLFLPFMQIIIVLLGLLDQWFNFRQIQLRR